MNADDSNHTINRKNTNSNYTVFQFKQETLQRTRETMHDDEKGQNNFGQRTRGGRVHSDAVRYPFHASDPPYSARITPMRATNNGQCTASSGRKTESEPGSWSVPRRSSENSGLYNLHEYPKRPPPSSTHLRHHRTDPRKVSRSREHVSTGIVNDTTAHLPDRTPRSPIESGFDSWSRKHGTSSMENIASAARHSNIYKKKRSISPRAKPRPKSLSNLNTAPDATSVRLPNGNFVTLQSFTDESIGDALTAHLTFVTQPLECVDTHTDKLISWSIPVRELQGRDLTIRNIGLVSMLSPTPTTPLAKKMEKRSSTSTDNLTAAYEWFEFCTRRSVGEPSSAEKLEIRSFLERPPPCLDCDPSDISADIRSFLLNEASNQSIFNLQNFDSFRWKLDEYRKHLFTLEENWDVFVKTDRILTTRQQKRQSAIWEVFTTELNYINYLRAILDIYFDPFVRIREQQFLDLDDKLIFNRLEEVYFVNLRLWIGYLHPAYCKAKETGQLLDVIHLIKRGFQKIPKLFIPYTDYCVNLQRCQRYIKATEQKNPSFSAFLRWADNVGSEQREPLMDRITRPFKRITQYNVMLESIRKYCEDPDEIRIIDQLHAGIEELLNGIDQRMPRADHSGRLELLDKELVFIDIPEKMDEDYRPLFDRYKRVSLMEDISLPDPIMLTVPEVHSILGLNPQDVEDQLATSLIVPNGLRSDWKPHMYASEWNLDRRNTSPLNEVSTLPMKQPNRSHSLSQNVRSDLSNMPRHESAVHVLLTRWEPPDAYASSKLHANILDRIRSAHIPIESRRTLPRALLRKGNLPVREAQGKNPQWKEATCYLLTDQFIIGQPQKRGHKNQIRILRSPIRLDKLVVHRLPETGAFACAVLDDFHMIIAVYTFQTSQQMCDEWYTLLKETKERYMELMRPPVVCVTPQGRIPMNWFMPSSNPSTPTLGSAKNNETIDEDQGRPTLLWLSSTSSRRMKDSIGKAPYRRPLRPNAFNPPKEPTLLVTDFRARPLQTPPSVPNLYSDGIDRSSQRVSSPYIHIRDSYRKPIIEPASTWSPRAGRQTPIFFRQGVQTLPINGAQGSTNDSSAYRLSMRSKLNTVSPNPRDDTNNGVSMEDRVIELGLNYGSPANDEEMKSNLDLNKPSTGNRQPIQLSPTQIDGNDHLIRSTYSQEAITTSIYPSSISFGSSGTASSSTRC